MSQNEHLKSIRREGHRELAAIYEKHRMEFMQWVVKRFHCSVEDSKDIYQITFLIFYENVKNGKLESLASSIKTYLFAIGKNVVREHLRKTGARTRTYDIHLFREDLAEEEELADEYFFEAANNAVARLNGTGRQFIELYYYGRKSMEEITALLKYKNTGTAKNQKCRIMARLRKLFNDELRKTQLLKRLSPSWKDSRLSVANM